MAQKIYIGADHAGFELKEKIKKWLEKKEIAHLDLGNLQYEPLDDYPDFASKVAKRVVSTGSLGLLVCGSAQGVCIAANKIKGIRAAVPFSVKEAKLSREHTDANVMCLSGWYSSLHEAKKMIEAFLNTPFSTEERHRRRVEKIRKIELLG